MAQTLINNLNQELPLGATALSEEDTQSLIPKHITTRQELFDAEFKNITMASQKYIFSGKKLKWTLAELYRIHAEMFGKVWKWAGKKRTSNTNIGVDKFDIDVEFKKLLDDFNFWIQKKEDPIEVSARLHHRLVQIHPFNNGNGRWARFVTNLYLNQSLKSYLDFPEDELFLTTVFREMYLEALRAADKYNYKLLIELHQKYLKK